MSFSGQVVDTETAQEFMAQILDKISKAELGDVVGELETKAARYQELLAADRLPTLTEDEVYGLLRHSFATRRRARPTLDTLGLEFFHSELPALLYSSDDPAHRLETFVNAMDGSNGAVEIPVNTRCDLATEFLHFLSPDEYPLWARWMWDPRPRTGSLPLVVEDSYDLMGETPGEIYTKVSIAVAFVKATGEAAGFSKLSNSPFDIDVFLACVYAIYAYTTLRMRMTQEFNKVVPQLPELIRRLLGVWRFDM